VTVQGPGHGWTMENGVKVNVADGEKPTPEDYGGLRRPENMTGTLTGRARVGQPPGGAETGIAGTSAGWPVVPLDGTHGRGHARLRCFPPLTAITQGGAHNRGHSRHPCSVTAAPPGPPSQAA